MYFAKWRNDLPVLQLQVFSQLVGPGRKVLDAGCGPGHHTNYLHQLGHIAVGIDLSHAALKLAKESFKGPEFLYANMLNTPFAADEFAGIWACASVMHLPEALLEPLLIEFRRVLASRGVVALTMTLEKESHLDAFGRYFHFYPRDRLLERIAKAGFELHSRDERLRSKTTEPQHPAAEWTTITARKV
jgi:SAM-dependent methyltransferase